MPFQTAIQPGFKIYITFLNGHTLIATKNGNIVTSNYPTIRLVYSDDTFSEDYPIKIEGEFAGENFIKANATHEFLFTGSAFEDLTATVIYKGTNTNGDYSKYRDDKYNQTTIQRLSGLTITRYGRLVIIDYNGVPPYNGVVLATPPKPSHNGYVVGSCLPGGGYNNGITGQIYIGPNENKLYYTGYIGSVMYGQITYLTD